MKNTALLFTLLYTSVCVFGQINITLTVPNNTPEGALVYLAANINSWNPANTPLTNNANGTYSITLNPPIGLLEFKFTRGTWTSVEGDAAGGEMANRTYNYTGQAATLNLTVLSWKDLTGTPPQHTANAQVSIIAQDFYIPQLNKTRRVWIYLPQNYTSSTQNYPVLYLHDGQNVFDAYTSFAGEWEIDESLTTLEQNGFRGVIAVAIDNGNADRLDEYAPWENTEYNEGGSGDEYVEFLVSTLKPYIDQHYRTLPNQDNTGIMGSSMGGLISLYAATKHPDVFGRVGVFSPALWFNKPQIYDYVAANNKTYPQKFYLLCGQLESSSMVSDMFDLKNALLTAGFDTNEIAYEVHADGQHSEWFWKREFPDAHQWLFADYANQTSNIAPPKVATFSPNPARHTLNVALNNYNGIPTYLTLSDTVGKTVLERKITTNNAIINISGLPKGVYIARLSQMTEVRSKREIVVIDTQQIVIQ